MVGGIDSAAVGGLPVQALATGFAADVCGVDATAAAAGAAADVGPEGALVPDVDAALPLPLPSPL